MLHPLDHGYTSLSAEDPAARPAAALIKLGAPWPAEEASQVAARDLEGQGWAFCLGEQVVLDHEVSGGPRSLQR